MEGKMKILKKSSSLLGIERNVSMSKYILERRTRKGGNRKGKKIK
jgi:hypothetical protein